jgi:hypothetical protein
MAIKSPLQFLETGLSVLVLLSLVGLGLYFFDLMSPEPTANDPFATYNTNRGIIRISTASLVARALFITMFLLMTATHYRSSRVVKSVYLFSALLIAFLQWYELYYGSTFYYGEVRDKQGLMFPYLASLCVTLVIWKINYSKAESLNMSVKIILTITVNIGLYIFWRIVYDSWKLWQS